jgi:hypothetical protein
MRSRIKSSEDDVRIESNRIESRKLENAIVESNKRREAAALKSDGAEERRIFRGGDCGVGEVSEVVAVPIGRRNCWRSTSRIRNGPGQLEP